MSGVERERTYRRIDKLVSDQLPYVLLWHTDEQRILYWNRFGTPAGILGRYSNEEGALLYWWHDEDRAAELAEAVGGNSFLPTVPVRIDYDKVSGR
jgi:microcin C transport system substrate-binding protein